MRLRISPGSSNTPQGTRNNVPDLQRAMSMKTLVENGKICSQTMTGERLERIGAVWIVDETDCFRLNFIEKVERERERERV